MQIFKMQDYGLVPLESTEAASIDGGTTIIDAIIKGLSDAYEHFCRGLGPIM